MMIPNKHGVVIVVLSPLHSIPACLSLSADVMLERPSDIVGIAEVEGPGQVEVVQDRFVPLLL